MKETVNLVFLGGPGSGKDTQIEKLKNVFDSRVISTGDICREKAKNDPKIKGIIESGHLIDDDTIIKWLKETVKKIDSSKSIIFNGFPRDISQAEALENILRESDRKLEGAIFLKVSEDTLVYRLTKRVYCEIYGKKIIMDREDCTNCGGKIIRRSDDSPETILNRIKIFHNKIAPLINFYDRQNKLIDINGDGSVEEVLTEILKKLEN